MSVTKRGDAKESWGDGTFEYHNYGGKHIRLHFLRLYRTYAHHPHKWVQMQLVKPD